VIDMATSAILESESYLYAGPMALCDEGSLAAVTRSITELGELAKAGNVKVEKQLGEITEHTQKSDARILALEQKILTGGGAGGRPGTGGGVIDVAALIAGDAKLDAFRKGDAQRIQVPIGGHSLRTITKSVLTSAGGGASPDVSFPTFPEILPVGIRGFAQRRLQVLESLNSLPVSTGLAEVPVIVSDSDAAAVQQFEGDTKAETILEFAAQQLRPATIATVTNISRQLLSDSPLLAEFVRVVLLYGCLKKFENLVCTGQGPDTADQIEGLVTGGAVFSSAASHPADRIGEAMAYMSGLGYVADLIVLAPSTYFDLIAAKDDMGRYLSGVGWSGPLPGTIWGVKAVPSAALGASQGIVLDTQQVCVLDRQEPMLSFGFVSMQFQQNVISALMELRANLAIYDARAVQVLTLPANSPG
jgi:HK97 family phage major capsid protein